jgi:hypothetical protein
MPNQRLNAPLKASVLVACAILLLPLFSNVSAAADDATELFICETQQQGKYLAIYGVEQGPDDPWSSIQYRFGGEGAPDMVYPADPSKGARSLFFSHESRGRGADYYVSIRFRVGGYTYRLYSHSGAGGAGVTVSNAKGRMLSRIRCIERPYMFPAYLQRSLACDEENPHGRAACREQPYRGRR